MKSNVGYSTLESSYEAGKETAKKSKAGLKNPKMALLYTSVDYDQAEVVKGVREYLPDIPIVGCTSAEAIVVPDGIITSDHGFAGMLTLDDNSLVVGVAGSEKKGSARETGRKVAMQALEDAGADYAPSYYYMAATSNEEEYIKGVQDIIGDVPLFGGSPATNKNKGDCKIICNEKCYSDGVVVVFFYTEKPIETVYTGSYKESKHVGIITKVTGDRKLVEIDGVPALEKYAEWTNQDLKNIKGADLLVASIPKPLGIKEIVGDLIAIRHLVKGNDDNSIEMSNKVVENTAIIQMESTEKDLINSPADTLKELNKKLDTPAAYLLIHSEGRRVGLGNNLKDVHKKLVKEAKGVPFITIFTRNEYGYNEHSRNTCGGLMLSFTGFEK